VTGGAPWSGQVVDTPTAQEFRRLVLERVAAHDLGRIAARLEEKAARFRDALAPDRLPGIDEATARDVLRLVFSSRRKAKVILDTLTLDGFAEAVGDLLWDAAPVGERLQAFHERVLRIGRNVPVTTGFDLGSELLHFVDPERHWLWTRWMWNPESGTGSLPLVVMENVDLDGGDVAETYLRVGVAVAFLDDVGEAAGFRMGRGVFATDIFLAAVYGIYMYTTLRMRMTKEFNRIIPDLDELVRRLLGVNRVPEPAQVTP